MTVREWMAPGLAERPVLKGRIDEILAAWSQTWLVGRRLEVVRWEAAEGDPAAGLPAAGRSLVRTLALAADARAVGRLLERGLDVDLSAASQTDADRRILDALSGRMFEDLLSKLEAGLVSGRLAGEARYDGGARVGLGEGEGGVLVWLAVPAAVLAPAARAALAPARAPSRPPEPLAQALAGRALQLQAVLGSARLGLSELRGLSVGDVLVLDRPLAEPACLQLATSGRVAARAHLIEVEGRMALALTSDQS